VAVVLLWFCVPAFGQVEIRIPQQRYKQYDRIEVVLTNRGTEDVSFCLEYGQRSFLDADHVEATPTPVYVKRNTKRGWDTLLNGPDVGSMRHSVTLGPGESQHYPFRLSDTCSMRAMVDYWMGESDRTCESPKERKIAKSRVFLIE
jgi:hypothetical protein